MQDADQPSNEEPAGTATADLPKPTDADLQSLEEKLQRLSEELQPGEQKAMQRLLALATAGNEAAEAQGGDDVKGYMGFLDAFMIRQSAYRTNLNRVNLSSFRTVLRGCGAGTCVSCKKIGGFGL